MTNVFDYVKSASHNKKDLSEEPDFEQDYNPFVVNKAFSLFPDTILHANMMNMNHHISKRLQYRYYLNTLRAKPRFTQWPKKFEEDEITKQIALYFGMSLSKARIAMSVLKKEAIDEIIKRTSKGGVNE